MRPNFAKDFRRKRLPACAPIAVRKLGREPIKRPVRFVRSEGTGRRQRALFQRQKQFRDRLMLRHLREEAQPLAINREVACFLAAGRKPVAIKVERGGL